MSDTFAVTATYDRNPPNYNAGETIRITISGTNTHTTDPTTTSSPINGFQISVEAGIAENITKFLANLAFAPMFGQLSAISHHYLR